MPHEQREYRSVRMDGIEVRDAQGGKGRMLVGYAARFNVEAIIGGYMREKIRPGAFREVLKTADCRCLAQHDDALVLGRAKAGTLRLTEDDVGLRYECDLPDTQAGRDMAVTVARGDISGSSFQFAVGEQLWNFSDDPAQLDSREIIRVSQLWDVGPVTFPAYDEADVAVRSVETGKRARDEARAAWDLELARDRDLGLRIRLASAT